MLCVFFSFLSFDHYHHRPHLCRRIRSPALHYTVARVSWSMVKRSQAALITLALGTLPYPILNLLNTFSRVDPAESSRPTVFWSTGDQLRLEVPGRVVQRVHIRARPSLFFPCIECWGILAALWARHSPGGRKAGRPSARQMIWIIFLGESAELIWRMLKTELLVEKFESFLIFCCFLSIFPLFFSIFNQDLIEVWCVFQCL